VELKHDNLVYTDTMAKPRERKVKANNKVLKSDAQEKQTSR